VQGCLLVEKSLREDDKADHPVGSLKASACSRRRSTTSIVSLLLLSQGADLQHRRTGELFLAFALPYAVATRAVRPMLSERAPAAGPWVVRATMVLTRYGIWHREAAGNGRSRSDPRRRCAARACGRIWRP